MSIKVVEGQVEFWRMVAEQIKADKSLAATMFKELVKAVSSSQSQAPDVLLRANLTAGKGTVFDGTESRLAQPPMGVEPSKLVMRRV